MLNLNDLRSGLPDQFLVIALIVLVVLLNLFFVFVAVLPRWQAYEQVASGVAAGKTALAIRDSQVDTDDMRQVIAAQLNNAQTQRDQIARIFLTPAQADTFVERLYSYAASHGIAITNLQAQQALQIAENGVYEIRAFRLQAAGSIHELVKATAAMNDIAVPSIALNEIAIGSGPQSDMLTMTIMIYTSPYAADNGWYLLSVVRPSASQTLLPEFSLPDSSASTLPIETTPVEAPPVVVECPGAPLSPFRPGDAVIVDFHDIGALKILEAPSGFAMLTQVYDGTRMRLLDGPVCGTWRGENILYWFVEVETDGMQGWAGEGDSEDRWLCPLTDAECAR